MILAFDPGIRTLSWAVATSRGIEEAGSVDLLQGQPKTKHKQYAFLVWQFVKKHRRLFKKAKLIVIEAQMSAKMKQVQVALQCLGDISKTLIVPPIRWRRFHNISHGSYKLNKKASVQMVQSMALPENVRTVLASKKKKDDICESILLGLYALTL